MANVISAVPTNVGRDQFAKATAGLITSVASYFLIGEGGYIVSGGVKTPKTPLPSRTRLEAQGVSLTGTLTFTNGSATVTGSGTLFTSELATGKWIRPDGPVDGLWYQVLGVTDNLTLTLSAPFAGVTSPGPEAASRADEPFLVFKKTFTGADVLFEGVGTARTIINTLVDFTEANADQLANPPEFFEIAVFDNNNVMLCYGTFPEEIKTPAKTLSNVLKYQF